MDNTVLVSNNARPSDILPHSAPFRFKNTLPTIQTVKSSHTVSEASTFSSLAQFGLRRELEEVILAAWKPKTVAKYKSFIDRWKLFCVRGSENC